MMKPGAESTRSDSFMRNARLRYLQQRLQEALACERWTVARELLDRLDIHVDHQLKEQEHVPTK